MRCAKTGRQGRVKGGLFGLLLTATSALAAAACDEHSTAWQAAHVRELSELSEFDAAGRKLVHESGLLHGAALSVGVRCSEWNFLGALSQLDGTRGYDGQTSTGVLATSRSTLRQRQAQLQANLEVTAAWQLGGRLSHQVLWRDIASIPAVSGFPERFSWTIVSLGTQWTAALTPGQLTLAAWIGKPLASGMQLYLPGRDPATLVLGTITQLELNAGWRTQLTPKWHLQADVGYRRVDMGQGEETVITRGGAPIGVAHQPKTSMVDVPLTMSVGYAF